MNNNSLILSILFFSTTLGMRSILDTVIRMFSFAFGSQLQMLSFPSNNILAYVVSHSFIFLSLILGVIFSALLLRKNVKILNPGKISGLAALYFVLLSWLPGILVLLNRKSILDSYMKWDFLSASILMSAAQVIIYFVLSYFFLKSKRVEEAEASPIVANSPQGS